MKKMQVLTTRSVREMVKSVNQFNEDNPENVIQKDDIVSILKGDGQYFLIYFN